MRATDEVLDTVRSAERILVPTSKDSGAGIRTFMEFTGIEIPDAIWDKEYVESDGRSFRLVRPGDMPSQIAAGWGDVGISSTEMVEEAQEPEVNGYAIGNVACRYSVLAMREVADEWQDFLVSTSRYPKATRTLPASFPRYLNSIAAVRDLPLVASPVKISGKAEATMRVNGDLAVADRAVTGTTAARMGAKEVYTLAPIFTEIVIRRQDENGN